jgi:subtilisin family serine protease
MENGKMFVSKFAATKMSLAIKLCIAATAVGAMGSAAAAADENHVIVGFKAGKASKAKGNAYGKVKHDLSEIDAMALVLTAKELKKMKEDVDVEYVEDDVKRYPFFAGTTPSTGAPYQVGQLVPYGIIQTQADQLSDVNASNRKLCIIDSGYDRNHEDLGKGTNVTGEYDAGTGWWYTDENHHGSHVAGTISAVNNGGVGVVGVNPNQKLKLHIVKVFGADGWAYSSSLAAAANKCGAAGANVISMSLGGTTSSKTEQKAFDALQTKGVLSIAAAGNDGNTAISYPAGYASVMMVAAIDESKNWASFSQYNSKVEIAGPGVNVLSTVPMGAGSASTLSVGGTAYAPGGMDGSPKSTASAALADFGYGDVVNPSMAGKVCLISRGTIDFATKVMNCQNSGGIGAIIFNNAAGGFGGTMGTTVSAIPSVTATDVEGASMKTKLGQLATVAVTATNYAFYDGTSMATPHVSAVAALVWSYKTTCTGAQIRASLTKSAMDLGPVGRDVKYGYGLVQAKAAKDRILSLGCGN